jgi:UDP-GlcNAc:undecaprenyl-phosphate GlcNAc-1-phosphate transferase
MSLGQGLLLVAATAGFGSFLSAFVWRRYSVASGVVDQPTGGRKIHDKKTPLLGGLAVASGLLLGMGVAAFFIEGLRPALSIGQLVGFAAAIVILGIGGFLDDRFSLPPKYQVVFPVLASCAVILSGTSMGHVTNLFHGGPFSLAFASWSVGPLTLSLPADLIAFVWLMTVTYATKMADGLDGLVAGQGMIGAGLIAALTLSALFFQPSVAFLAIVVAASFAGFLPHNLHPAKQFLGEAGSTIAGFSLGFLSMLGGAKVAIGFMALGLPLADALIVIVGRLLRGASPFKGDDTHLHFKLLRAGLSQRQVVVLFWLISLGFGLVALGLQSRGKLLLVVLLVALTAILSLVAGTYRKRV